MAISEAFTGTATIGATEWSLTNNSSSIAAQSTAGVYQLFLDLNALAAGDAFQLVIYEKVITSATQRVVVSAVFANAQGTPNWVAPSMVLMNGWDFTLKKLVGVDRSIIWSIRQLT